MRHRNEGLTLIELIFATIIVGFSLMVVAGVMMGASKGTRASGATTETPLVAQSTLEKLKAQVQLHKADLVSTYGCDTPSTSTLQPDPKGPVFTRTVTVLPERIDQATGKLVKDCVKAEAYHVTIKLAWSTNGAPHMQVYQQTISADTTTQPYIQSFTSSNTYLSSPGKAITLSWSIPIGTQPVSVTITGTDGTNKTNLHVTGSLKLNPTTSVTYTLTAKNNAGTVTKTVTVYVDNIDIKDFTATPPIVGPQETFQLDWSYTSSFAKQFEKTLIDQGVGDVTGKTSTPAGPIAATTTYTLTLQDRNAPPDTFGSATTQVQYSAYPVIKTFTIKPTQQCSAAPSSNSVTVSWLVYAAKSVTINGSAVATSGSKTYTLTASTPFVLKATNALGTSRQQSKTATILAYPGISFTANPSSIVVGTPTTLSWNVTNTTSTVLKNLTAGTSGSVAATGSQQAYPTGNTTYEIDATNQGACPSSQQRSVAVQPIHFQNVALNPTAITQGQTATITFDFDNTFNPTYHKVLLINTTTGSTSDVTGDVSSNHGSVQITPGGSSSYTLRLVDRHDGQTLDSAGGLGITVVPPPKITGFTATNARNVTGGTVDTCGVNENVTLDWSTSAATTIQLDGAPVAASGSASRGPVTTTTTYHLSASNSLGYTVTATATANQIPLPSIGTWQASPNPMAEATISSLQWAVSGADNISIGGILSHSPMLNGSQTVSPASNTSYTLSAYKGPCSTSRNTTLQVTPITITSFKSDRNYVTVGGSRKLTWSVSPYIDATYHKVLLTGPGLSVDVSGQGSTGSYTVSPTGSTGTRTYTLTVYNRLTGQALDSSTTSFQIVPAPVINSYSVNPTLICSSGSANASWNTYYGAVTLNGKSEPGIGSDSVSLSSSGAVTLSVTNLAGTSTSQAKNVTVTPRPTITSFTASTTSPVAGQPVTVSWSVSNAPSGSVTLTTPSGTSTVSATGSTVIVPTSSTTLVLTAHDPSGACSNSSRSIPLSVTVPAITQWSGNKSVMTAGATLTANWATSNLNSTYQKLVYTVTGGSTTSLTGASGSTNTVPPQGTPVTYTLKILAQQNGAVLAQRAFTVNVYAPPSIDSFYESGASMCTSGTGFTLYWQTSNANTVTLDGVGVSVDGSKTESLNGSKTYTLVAKNPAGATVSKSITVQNYMKPNIYKWSFWSQDGTDPGKVHGGNTYQISWGVSSSTSVNFNGGWVGSTGTHTVNAAPLGYHTYTIHAYNGPSCGTSKSVTVHVYDFSQDFCLRYFTPDGNARTYGGADAPDCGWITYANNPYSHHISTLQKNNTWVPIAKYEPYRNSVHIRFWLWTYRSKEGGNSSWWNIWPDWTMMRTIWGGVNANYIDTWIPRKTNQIGYYYWWNWKWHKCAGFLCWAPINMQGNFQYDLQMYVSNGPTVLSLLPYANGMVDWTWWQRAVSASFILRTY